MARVRAGDRLVLALRHLGRPQAERPSDPHPVLRLLRITGVQVRIGRAHRELARRDQNQPHADGVDDFLRGHLGRPADGDLAPVGGHVHDHPEHPAAATIAFHGGQRRPGTGGGEATSSAVATRGAETALLILPTRRSMSTKARILPMDRVPMNPGWCTATSPGALIKNNNQAVVLAPANKATV